MQLLSYDDYQLDDMGYSRQDLLDAVDLPLKIDARKILAKWREQHIKGNR